MAMKKVGIPTIFKQRKVFMECAPKPFTVVMQIQDNNKRSELKGWSLETNLQFDNNCHHIPVMYHILAEKWSFNLVQYSIIGFQK